MGNCIGGSLALCHNGKKVSPDEGDTKLEALAVVDGKIGSDPGSGLCGVPLPLAAVLKSGDVYRLIPQPIQQHSLQAPPAMAECNGQRVKIVVTKKQLKLLMKSMEELKLRQRSQKWRPSLATIPEL
ncbi:hypothetical protein Salat_0281400 [Sesamum alatum]|uniref:Uncharacterized protein n=1 Tax=Sesamum alatum TaxID=300844 RepID=A0AAE1YZD0_9LAMI|nr:hypothetical protein Salat_0281400 [Sesamum alatum]